MGIFAMIKLAKTATKVQKFIEQHNQFVEQAKVMIQKVEDGIAFYNSHKQEVDKVIATFNECKKNLELITKGGK